MTDIQSFKRKAEILSDVGTAVTPLEYYRDIFPQELLERPEHPEDRQPNPIIMYTIKTDDGKVYHRNELMLADYAAVEKVQKNIFAVCSMISYSGRERTAKNAYRIHGFCIDLDGVGERELKNVIYGCGTGAYPTPTYICNSGHGLHLVYVFQSYIPLYPALRAPLQGLKQGLTYRMWNYFTSSFAEENRQFQGIYQGFRMPGTCTKLGTGRAVTKYLVTAYRMGQKWSVEQLSKYVDEEFRMKDCADWGSYEWGDDEHVTLERAKELYPEWYHKRIELNLPRGHYETGKGVYRWWLGKLQQTKNVQLGHRYHCIKCLFIYAMKCGIPFDVAYNDALSFLDAFNEIEGAEDNPFSVDDIDAASKMYNESYYNYSRKAISMCTNILILPQRKNGRTQDKHLKGARALEEINHPDWRNGNGRKPKQELVAQWRAEHPDGRKADCIRDTGLSKPTVLKWWK